MWGTVELKQHMFRISIRKLLQLRRLVRLPVPPEGLDDTDDPSCGSTAAYCAIGKCQEGGCDGGKPYSTDGRCGAQNRQLECGGTGSFGTCCSTSGW